MMGLSTGTRGEHLNEIKKANKKIYVEEEEKVATRFATACILWLLFGGNRTLHCRQLSTSFWNNIIKGYEKVSDKYYYYLYRYNHMQRPPSFFADISSK
jgi:hypothetical protein